MNRRYFWQIPEMKRFSTVFEDAETVLGAGVDNQHRLFRKDTGLVCFDEREVRSLCVARLADDEDFFSEKNPETKRRNDAMKRITIIGSGASGTLLAANLLLNAADCPLEINLVERRENVGRGVAYSTVEACHLLNVPAAKMGAFATDAEHFYRWLDENDYDYQPTDFVPRKIYGEYLRDVLARAIANKNANARINLVDDEAVDILTDDDGSGAQVILKSGEILFSDKVVLAFGNFPPPAPPVKDSAFTGADKYFPNSWDGRLDEKLAPADDVFIVGAGLSMVDVVLRLRQTGHSGKIFAISTRGLLPAVHRANRAIAPLNGEITSQFKVTGILKTVREKIRETEAAGGDWRAVIDALRPVTQAAWLNLGAAEKQRFMRHLRRIWDVSRHRMPPECASVLNQMRAAKQLHVKKGRLREINSIENGRFQIVFSSNGLRNVVTADAVINCMGSQSDLTRIDFPLIKNLLAEGTITTDALRLGVNALPDGRTLDALGGVSKTVYAIGTALKGVLWESTAIPEIRTQAHRMATALLE